MKICLVDIDAEALEQAEQDLRKTMPAEKLMCRRVDVSDRAAVEKLCDEVYESFGEVGLLMNNAAAFLFAGSFREPEAWERTFAVNVMGIVNGLSAFVPRMIEQATPCAIVNTGSKQGITNPPGIANYNAAKAAVKSLTESLQHELRSAEDCQVSAHLLVPGWTTTGGRKHQPGAWRAEQVADHLIEALGRGDFYVLCPDNEVTPEMDRKRILWGAMDLTENRPPLSRWHPDHAEDFESFEP